MIHCCTLWSIGMIIHQHLSTNEKLMGRMSEKVMKNTI